MSRLGYDRFGAQGGDWGSTVTRALADAFPDRVTGIHLNMVTVRPDRDGDLTDAEQRALERLAEHREQGTGYSTQQATRPQTLGYGLTDSPAGQLGWILEKFATWADCDGDPVGVLGADRLLDNAMLYWVPGNAASSARLYWESFRREAWPPTVGADGRGGLPARDLHALAALGREGVHRHPPLVRTAVRRALRRLRAAAGVRRGGARLLPHRPLTSCVPGRIAVAMVSGCTTW